MDSRVTPFGVDRRLFVLFQIFGHRHHRHRWLSNQDCISIILASFTGSPSAIIMYRLYSSIDLLLHSTFTRRWWFGSGRGVAAVLEWKRRGAAVVLECKGSGGR